MVAGNMQQASLAMKNAYDIITTLKENDDKKQKEVDQRCTQAKEKIDALRRAVVDRDKIIEELQTAQVCENDSYVELLLFVMRSDPWFSP